jgi:multidrug efflux pump subunit AcrA (membrane-fusion protein)
MAVAYGVLTLALVAMGTMAYGAISPTAASTSSNSRVVTAQMGTVTQSVSATGNVQPASTLNVGFSTPGTVSEVDATVGQHVQAGDVLARLDPTAAQTALQVAQLNLTSAQAKLSNALAGSSTGQGSTSVASLQTALANDQQALADVQQQASVNANGYQLAVDQAQAQLDKDQQQQDQAAVDKDKNALANARQNQAAGLAKDKQGVDQASAKVASDQAAIADAQAAVTSAAADPSAVASAQAGVLQAGAAVTAAQQAVDDTVLTAPSSGTITALTGLVGQTVSAAGTSAGSGTSSSTSATGGAASATPSTSSAFLTLVDTSALQVKVGFAEIDAVKVAAGQPATITVAALPGTQLTGSIVAIDPNATVVSNVVTYNALVSMAGPPPALKPGMTASVNVQVASRPNVLAVPTAAIQTRGAASFVNVDVNGAPVQTTVTTGLQGDSSTEIVSGLTDGQQLLVSTGTATAAATPVAGAGGGGLGGGTGGVGGGRGNG